MPSTIGLHRMFHFNKHMGQILLLAVNMLLLVPIGLLSLTPLFDLASGWSDNNNLFALLMLIGLALIPLSLLVSAYFVKGDPLVCPICKVVATYNILAAIFLFYHVIHSPEIDALDLAYSIVIGIVAVLNTLALLFRLRGETVPASPAGTQQGRSGS